MEEGAEDDEDVPDAMIVGVLSFFVMYEEIDTRGVGDALQNDEHDGAQIYAFAYRWNDIEYRPSEEQIEQEGGLGQSFEKEDFQEDACKGEKPDDSKR